MTRAWTKILLVTFGLLGMTSSFGQDVTLKKLYDGIEDLHQGSRYQNQTYTPIDYFAEISILENQLGTKTRTRYAKNLKDCDPNPEGQKFWIEEVLSGSFLRPSSKQKLIIYQFCAPLESYYYECQAVLCGMAIVENGIVLANFENKADEARRYTVKDINQNGLAELMLVVQSRASGIWAQLDAVQILEFSNSTPTSLGSFFVGGPATFFEPADPDPIDPSFDVPIFKPTKICTKSSPEKSLRDNFPSNILYVQTSKKPQFFAEGWEVNCDFRVRGVKARKVSSLTPIKPVPRAVPLTRLF
jgi:hypothetical protein